MYLRLNTLSSPSSSFFFFLKKIRGEMPPKKPLQLQRGSPANMNQYTPEQLCTKFGAFITM